MTSHRNLTWQYVMLIALGVYVVTETRATQFNECVIQAWAILHGHLYVDKLEWHTAYFTATKLPAPNQLVAVPRAIHESVIWGGHQYLLHPPGAALVLLPFVAMWGERANQTLVSVLVAALNVGLAYRLLGRIGSLRQTTSRTAQEESTIQASSQLWLTTFFAFGTILWYEGTLGASWGFTLTLSMVPTLLTLTELYGDLDISSIARIGLFAGLAALCRYDLAAVIPVYVLWIWSRLPTWEERTVSLIPFCVGMLLPAFIYLWFVNGRFGTWGGDVTSTQGAAVALGNVKGALANLNIIHWPSITLRDKALWLWYAQDDYSAVARKYGIGPFSLKYLPWNLYTAFFLAPKFEPTGWYVHPTAMGQALIFTSPAFLMALKAPLRKKETLFLWLAVALGMSGALCVWANGFVQFGARYWIMVFPFLLVLMARTPIDQFAKILIVVSVVLMMFFGMQIRLMGAW